VTFETPSKLYLIESEVFSECSSLSSICIPSSVNWIDVFAFSVDRLSLLQVDEQSRSFVVRRDLLLDFDESSLIWSFGRNWSVTIPRTIQRLCRNAFSNCHWISSIVFETNSTVSEIEAEAFSTFSH
jgi:hypothetical protein